MYKPTDIPQVAEQLRQADPALVLNEEAVIAEYQRSYDSRSGIAVKALIVLGGFLASLSFVGFLMLLQIYESGTAMLVTGLGLCAGAVLLSRAYDKLVLDTMSISLYLSGLVMTGVGFEVLFHSTIPVLCFFYMLIAAATIIISQGYVFAFIAVLLFNGSILGIMADAKAFELVHLYIGVVSIALAWWMLNEAKLITTYRSFARLYTPVRAGLMVSLLAALASVGKRGLLDISMNYIWLSSVAAIAITLYVVKHILVQLGKADYQYKWVIYLSCMLWLLPTAFSPAIAGSVLILLLAFMVNYRPGVAISIAALVYFIGQYYYDLNFTLLQKSILLFIPGVLMLLFYFFTAKVLANEKV